jgi:hypothetical protein
MTLRIGWLGFHLEGVAALEALLQAQAPVAAVITLSPEAAEVFMTLGRTRRNGQTPS